jgi:hypothetical protein
VVNIMDACKKAEFTSGFAAAGLQSVNAMPAGRRTTREDSRRTVFCGTCGNAAASNFEVGCT